MNITPGSDELTTNTSLVTDARLTLELEPEDVMMMVGAIEWPPRSVTVVDAIGLDVCDDPHSYTEPSISCLYTFFPQVSVEII